MPGNDELKAIYDRAFSGGADYSGDPGSFFTFPTDDVTDFILSNNDFKGKTVLEVGCGTGGTAMAIAQSGAKEVMAIDYSEEAISGCIARHQSQNLTFLVEDYRNIRRQFDFVVLQEVIEHLDNPEAAIVDLIGLTNEGGKLLVTCPNFTNLRGHVWMTLQVLLNVPMSLTDLHFLSPFDFMEIARKNDLQLDWTTFAHDRVQGEKLMLDMRKRLTNALRDARLDNSRVETLLDWMNKAAALENQPSRVNGGKGYYVFTRTHKASPP